LDDLRLQILIGHPALIGLDLPLIALVGITRRRKKILTCTQDKTTRAKVERLRSARPIHRDLKAMKLDMQRLQSNTDCSLLATITNHL
jgi:hypothetical protein